nr:MAG TPA: hypothetical protein [Caudoviricetes sp.]
MAQAILLRGGAGGVTSDDVTAGKAQVLQGYKTVTTDSNDEVVEGAIISRGTWVIASEVINASWESNIHTRFEEGYYQNDGQYKPTAKIPYAVLANVIGVDSTKMLQSLTLVGRQGQIKVVDTGANNNRINKSTSYGIDNWTDTNNPIFYIDLAHGNAYYTRHDGRPHVCIDADKLGNTAADKVLAGSTFTSKNGLAVQGTMPNRGNGMKAVDFYNAHWESNFVARMEQGYYSQNGQWKPYVAIPYAVLANVAGIDPAKMLKSLTIAGRQGQIEERGSYIDAVGIWYYGAGNNLVGQIPPGYYGADNGNGKTNVNIKKQDIVNTLGLNPDLWLDTFQTMGIQGKIPRWICNTTDIFETTQGFAYNDAANGRGQGVVMAIKNGHKIENANWIFLRMPDLLPHNIRQGVNLGGVVGTMPDYSTGRTVFNGATFDGVLVSGVATKGFSYNGVYYAYNIQSGYGYGGIYGGGMNLQVTTTYPTLRSRRIGCVLSQSINVTPFRQIVVYYRSVANIQGSPYVSLEAHIIRASARGQEQIGGQLVDTVDVIRQGNASPAINREGQIVLNIGDINEQVFLSFGAFCNQNNAGDIFSGAVQITRIDFLN